jgi:broad specificity phosphatase PhoE
LTPLLRARQTAEIIGGHLGLDFTQDDRLKEYDCGAITGMSFEEVCAHFPEIAAAWQQNPWRVPVPGEEGVESFQQRVMSAIEDILARHVDGDALAVVAHGGTLSAYLAGLLGIDYRKRQPWVFDNASLSVIILGGVRPRIALLNDTCHLHRGQGRD